MKISRKKTISLMLLFTILMSVIMPTMVSALSYDLNDGDIINSYNITSDVVTLYVGNVSVDGTSTLKFLYTDKSVNTETLTEMRKILTSDYASLLPTTAGQVAVSNDSSIIVNDVFTDAGLVAANKYTGNVSDTSSTILYNQTQFNSLATASSTEISDEATAEANNLIAYNTRKSEWETAEQDKYNADPEYCTVDFPEEYVKAFNDTTTYPTTSYFIADNKGTESRGYIIRNGVVAQVNTYPVNRTIIKVVNTSANVTTTPSITTWAELQTALNAGGTVTLTQDIVATSSDTTLNIPGTATLDLNGYIIDGNGYATPVIRTKEYSGDLTLNDSNPTRTHSPAFTYKNPITNEDVVVNGGIITGGKDGDWGNGIDVRLSTFTMNGGSIVKNTTTTGNGAGVFVHTAGVFNMNGGMIAGNHSAGSGGGVYLYDRTTFNLKGGSIKHNTADGNGGGFYLWNNQAGYYDTLNMSGGRIEENKSTGDGGGICIDTRGRVYLSEKPVIIGNKKGNTNNNVYGSVGISGALKDGASVGITTKQSPITGGTQTFTSGYNTYNSGDNPANYFLSDFDKAAVTLDFQNEACLKQVFYVTVTAGENGTAAADTTSGVEGTEVTLTATPTDAENYRFKEWQVISGGITINDDKFNIGTSEVEVKAVFEQIPSRIVKFMDGETELFTQNIKDGEYITRPTLDPTKDGFTFDEWCLDSTLTTKFNFETTPITGNTMIYARWKAIPKLIGESVWRTDSSTATVRFNSNVVGTYYYVVTNSTTLPTANSIKEETSGVHGTGTVIIGTNPINLTGLSTGAQYLYIVVEQDNVFSNVLTIEMPYDSYFSDNYDSYASDTRISGLDSYSLQYGGTGSGNQIIISSEQKDGSTGNVLQLQGANSWASDVRHNFTPDSKQYVIFEANMKPVSGTDPGGVNFGSSSAGGYWTGSVCRAGLGLNNALYYGKNDISDDCDTDLTYSNGNWYNLKMILDNTNDVYYIFFDNQCVETIPYEADSATPEWFSLGGGNNGTNTIYYDDVKVYTTDTVEIPTPSYRIYVNSGTSSPSPRAEENTTVTITADELSNGSEFYRWNVISGGITLANDTSATTTFTMGTERVEVTALYKFVIPDQITYELRDSYGDGWHGNNKINIVDTSNNNTVESLTMSGSSLNGITQNLEPGHIYDLYWQKGSYPGECSFTLKDKDGNVLITRSGDDNASKEGVFLTVQVAEPTYYTVRFMDGETELSSEQVVEGGRVARPTTNPSKTNHIFLGWYADAALATEFDFDNTAITADTQIYAGFVKQGIFVYYNAGDGNGGTVFSDMINAGDTYNVRAFDSLTTFSAPSGKHFAGWNVSDGSQITKAQLESNPAKVINQIGNSATASITFTAYYEDDVYYTVSFMDGTNTISSQTILEGQKATRPTSDPTKANHEFVNWYADSTLTTVFNFNTPISRDMCIYAKFNPVYHDVTIPLSDGLVVPSGGGTFTEEQILGIEFLASKGIVICEEDDAAHVERWYTADRKLLFTFDENTKTIHFADGVSYKDNINYVLTDADKTLLAGYGAYINTITLNFGNAPFEYVILEGANQTHTVNQDGSLTVKANGDISKFVKLLVDRIEVAEKNRTIVSGSTVATLRKEFLDTLSEGTHELTFVYTDGEVSTNFTIARVSMPTQTGEDAGTSVVGTPVQLLSKSPITGDNIILWIILLVISVNVFLATEVYIRKVFKK